MEAVELWDSREVIVEEKKQKVKEYKMHPMIALRTKSVDGKGRPCKWLSIDEVIKEDQARANAWAQVKASRKAYCDKKAEAQKDVKRLRTRRPRG